MGERKEYLQFNELTRKIAECHRCTENVEEGEDAKMCVNLRTHTDWMPTGGVDTLFIAESPYLEDTYFYGGKSVLRENLLDILRIKGGKIGFKDRGLFFTDTVKCRKKKGGNITRKLIKECSGLLKEEISILQPEKIVALGRPALTGLKEIGFTELKYNTIRDFQAVNPITCQGYRVFVWYNPVNQSRGYWGWKDRRDKLHRFVYDSRE